MLDKYKLLNMSSSENKDIIIIIIIIKWRKSGVEIKMIKSENVRYFSIKSYNC